MNEFLLGAGSALVLGLAIWLWRKRGGSERVQVPPTAGPAWMKGGAETKLVVSSGDLSDVSGMLSKLQGFAGADPHIQVDTHTTTLNVTLEGLDDLIRAGKRDEAIRQVQAQTQLPADMAATVVDQVAKAIGR